MSNKSQIKNDRCVNRIARLGKGMCQENNMMIVRRKKTLSFLQLPELRISATESIRQKRRSLLGPSFLCSTTLVLEVFKWPPPGRAFPLSGKGGGSEVFSSGISGFHSPRLEAGQLRNRIGH